MKKQNPDEQNIAAVVRPSQDVFTAIFCSDAPISALDALSEKPAINAIDVDMIPSNTPLKRERPGAEDDDVVLEAKRDADDILAGIFGGTKKSKTLDLLDQVGFDSKTTDASHMSEADAPKRSKTMDMLEKTSAVKSFVANALDDKSKKKKKKDSKNKKKKKKKETKEKKKEEKYIYI